MATSATSRVLLVETPGFGRYAIAAGLRAKGVRVRDESPDVALEAVLRAFRPNVVLVGLGADPRDGLDVGRRVLAHGGIGLVFRGAEPTLASILAAFELGADDVVTVGTPLPEVQARLVAVGRRARPATAGRERTDLRLRRRAASVA